VLLLLIFIVDDDGHHHWTRDCVLMMSAGEMMIIPIHPTASSHVRRGLASASAISTCIQLM